MCFAGVFYPAISFNFAASMPEIFINFVLAVSPTTISIALLEIAKVFASSLINSAFAAPSIGAAAILIFNAPPNSPVISLFEARGATLTLNVTAPSFSV